MTQQADRARHSRDAALVEAAKWFARWVNCEKDYAELEAEAVATTADPDAAFLSAIQRYETARDKASLLEGTERTLTTRLNEEKERAEKTSATWTEALAKSVFANEPAFKEALLSYEERDRLQNGETPTR